MNYLGHIYHSYPHPYLMCGNLVNDMLISHERKTIDPIYNAGIVSHFRIDQFTDKHSSIQKMVTLCKASQGRYAPVFVDLILDFLICHNWYRYEVISYNHFCTDCYQFLSIGMQKLPNTLQERLKKMIQSQWLHHQASIEGLYFVFQKMDERTTYPSNFKKGLDLLLTNFEFLNRHFLQFWQDYRKFSPTLHQKDSLYSPKP